MKLTAADILMADHRINLGTRALIRTATSNIHRAEYTLDRLSPEASYMGRIGQAMARNAVCGLRFGLHAFCLGYSLPLPRILSPLQNLHLPTPCGRSFGLFGVSLATSLLVGKYGPTTLSLNTATDACPRMQHATGLMGLLADTMLDVNRDTKTWSGKLGAGACRWAAVLICVTSTALRTALCAVDFVVGVSFGLVAAAAFAAGAAVMQAVSQNLRVVSFEDLVTAQLVFEGAA